MSLDIGQNFFDRDHPPLTPKEMEFVNRFPDLGGFCRRAIHSISVGSVITSANPLSISGSIRNFWFAPSPTWSRWTRSTVSSERATSS